MRMDVVASHGVVAFGVVKPAILCFGVFGLARCNQFNQALVLFKSGNGAVSQIKQQITPLTLQGCCSKPYSGALHDVGGRCVSGRLLQPMVSHEIAGRKLPKHGIKCGKLFGRAGYHDVLCFAHGFA